MKRFRGGLVFKAPRLLYHSTLDLRVIKKKEKEQGLGGVGTGSFSEGSLNHLFIVNYD